ncbi:MAG: 2-dehydropantoate 2-reductase [Novosphingobium sp.]|nr:2-dehydropantoate 2-reductase [Novosphingobium sp.]
MKIAIVGCGAMGSIYAALLADAGNDVVVIDAWQAHVDAINGRGLRVEGISGDRTVRVVASTTIPETTVDLVVVAVKAAHVAAAAARLAPLIGSGTIVLTIQNGVGSADDLAAHVPADRIAVGIAGGFGAIMRGPGHAFHNGMNVIRIGPAAGLALDLVERVAEVWRGAGFKTEAVADVVAMQWEKLICNVAYSAPCALTGLTVGQMMDDPDMAPISQAAAREAWTVARALGIAIKVEDPVRLARDFAAAMPDARPSLLQDFENRRASEIDVINGAVPRAASRIGLEAPVNATLTALIKFRERQFAAQKSGEVPVS